MPSSRDPHKKMFGAYLSKQQFEIVKKLAERDGIPMTSVFKKLIMDEARRVGIVAQ